jgi:riboflavin-specific deaminase-like protein
VPVPAAPVLGMTGRPYVLLSAAMSADGYIDDASGTGLELSDPADWDQVGELRACSDAIMVGAQTIRSDNPRLLVKSEARRQQRVARGLPPNPRKVTITGSGELDPGSRFFAEADSLPLVYAGSAVASDVRARLRAAAIIVPVPATDRVDLDWMLADLAGRGIRRLMVEGGAQVLLQFVAANLADEFRLAVAPVVVADPGAPRLVAGTGLASGGLASAELGGRLQLAGVTQVGRMAVLRYLARSPRGS